MTIKTFNKVVNHIWPIIKYHFDFPLYASLPEEIIDELSLKAVNAMQNIKSRYDSSFKTKEQFKKIYKEELIRLGEKIGE